MAAYTFIGRDDYNQRNIYTIRMGDKRTRVARTLDDGSAKFFTLSNAVACEFMDNLCEAGYVAPNYIPPTPKAD